LVSLSEEINRLEKQIIEERLKKYDWVKVNTAISLDISRVTLYNKMKKHGIPFKNTIPLHS